MSRPHPLQASMSFRLLAFLLLMVQSGTGSAFVDSIQPFLKSHCHECHGDGVAKGGLDFDELGTDLSDPAVFVKWEQVYDRVAQDEMPPAKVKDRPGAGDRRRLADALGPALVEAHAAAKGTVLRRLNRREYHNALNDLFGTNLDLEGMLPEDGRSHEFDNVGEALGVSMTHLDQYLGAARRVFDTAVARTTEAPEPQRIEGGFRDSEIKNHVGKTWRRLEDGAIVRFQGGGYPSGLLRNSGVPLSGRYRVRVTGYAFQSPEPIVCSISGESYQRGSDKPVYTFAAFPPGKPATIEFETWIEQRYMLVVEPQGIALPQPKPGDIDAYEGPGFAFLSATLEGPLVGEFPSRGHQLVFDGLTRREVPPRNPADRKRPRYQPVFEIVTTDETADARLALHRVADSAWRRPVTDDEIVPYLELFRAERGKGADFEGALRTGVTALLVSPKFLYFREPAGKLDDHAVANRLSFFLNRTAPDEALRKLADQRGLAAHPTALRHQTDRLLQDARFDRFLTDFTESWLNLREMDFTVPDRTLFPEFDLYLRQSMTRETEAYLRELIRSNLPVRNLVKSDFAMLNGRLAALYGVPGVRGPEVRKVTLPPGSIRGGFLTQASVLKVSANGTTTSPVVRGVWVMERILGEAPKPPPPGIPGVEPDIRGARTLRQILDLHRNSQSCQACHQKIDPPGFALECFNPIGGFRERFRSLGGGIVWTRSSTVVRCVTGWGPRLTPPGFCRTDAPLPISSSSAIILRRTRLAWPGPLSASC